MSDISALLYNLSIWIVPLTIAIVFHEVAHGWVANYFGDPTAKQKGRLSFNPVGHIDPVGTLALPVVLALAGAPVFGWAKPVPVIARKMRDPRVHMMIVAFAGPGMNFLLALLGTTLLGTVLLLPDAGLLTKFLTDNFGNFILINIFLAIFNLIPIPPFDGSHIVEGILPRSAAKHYRKLRRFGFSLLLFLLVILPMVAPGVNPVQQFIVPPVVFVTNLYLSILGMSL